MIPPQTGRVASSVVEHPACDGVVPGSIPGLTFSFSSYTGGTVHHRRTTPHKSTQLLDSSHCDDELQARPPTIERPFQSTSPTGPPDLSVDTPTIHKCRSEPPKTHPFSPSERQPLSAFSPRSYSSLSTSVAPPSPAPPRPRRGPRLVPRPCDLRCARCIRCKRGRL